MVRLEQLTLIAAPIKRCFDLARSIEVHLLGTESTGEQVVAGVSSGLIGEGESVRWRAKHRGVRQELESRITRFDAPHYFRDTMVEGAFRSMRHDHFFRSLPGGTTEMRDVLEFEAPLSFLGLIAEKLLLHRYMDAFLRKRNVVLKGVAESQTWQQFLPADDHAV